MSGALPSNQPVVRIDRLVLEIPGLDRQKGRALATGIGEGLAKERADGEHKRAEVMLSPAARTRADLAARIVTALMERLS
jgi:hypothetical protein